MKTLNPTEEEFAKILANIKGARTVTLMPQGKPQRVKETRASRMNKTETQYAQLLEYQKRAGEIVWYGFEEIKLRLANGAYFTPDFMVIREEIQGTVEVEFHEVKGFWREAARVRIKVAAERFQYFKFRAVTKIPQKDGGGWREEHF